MTTASTKPASTATPAAKPVTTTTSTTTTTGAPLSPAAAARAKEDAVIAAARAKTIENTRARNKEAEAAGAKPVTTSTTTATQSNMDKARNRIQSALPADGAVRADPAQKPSVVGVQASEFKPQVKLKPSTAPPAPGQPNFAKRGPNDPPPLTNPLSR